MSRLVRALRNTAAYFKRNLPAYIDDWVQDTKLALTFRMVTYDPDRRLLYQFQNETDLQRFRVVSDREVDGESVAALTLGPERRTGVFSGTLSLQCAREGTRAGYAAVISEPRLRPWDLHLFDAFHVRVRGDGRTYTLNVKTKSGAPKDDIFQCFLKTRADEWSDVVLPFDRFLLTWRGYIKGEQSMNVERIVSLGITLADRAPGPFRLEIAHIAAVQRARLPRQSLGTLA